MSQHTHIWTLIAISLGAALPAAAVNCSSALPRHACTIEVDAQTKLVPGPTTVSSRTPVTIKVVNKGPLDPVKFTMDRAAATPPENPLSDLLTLIQTTGIPGALGAIHSAVAATPVIAQGAVEAAKDQPPIESSLTLLEVRVKGGTARQEALEDDYDQLATAAGNLEGCSAPKIDVPACRGAAGDLATGIRSTLDKGVPTFDDEQAALKEIDRLILQAGRSGEAGLMSRRDAVAAAIEAQQFAADKLKHTQTDLDTLAGQLKQAAKNATDTATFSVPRDRNTDTTVHVTFGSGDDKVEVLVVVHFLNWSWANMSAGVVFTTFRRDSFTVKQQYDPKIADPTKQVYTTIQQQTTTRQVIPMSFVNLQVPCLSWRSGGYDIAPTASVGVGVNVSTQSAEFAVGPGLHIGRVQLTVGEHWARSARLINGFYVGQTVDPSLQPPVNNPYVKHWSIGLTYRVR